MPATTPPLAINPATLPAPSGYSHGTLTGNTLYLGGQTALDREMKIVPGGIVQQFRQAFGNVLTTLRAAGGLPEDLVSITIFLTDIPDYQAHGREIGRVWRELAGPVYPAMAGIGTTALWQPEAMIEIMGVAVIPDERLKIPDLSSERTVALTRTALLAAPAGSASSRGLAAGPAVSRRWPVAVTSGGRRRRRGGSRR